jgi:sarcosine oxidase gamma subunit
MARIPTIVSRLDQCTFELLVDRAYGDYFANWLSAAAKRFA